MASSHYKLDLHTHSIRSHDGSITLEQYTSLLENKTIDFVAITDHNAIDFALHAQQRLGDKIIVGEEIWTAEGEVIGLFLNKVVPSHLTLEATFAHIKEQKGLVYIPHPFCHTRFGVKEEALLPLLQQVDIIEYFNPRNILASDNERARTFVLAHRSIMAASSDSHCHREVGMTYSSIQAPPTRSNLPSLLSHATYSCRKTPKIHLLCPKKNKIKKKIGML